MVAPLIAGAARAGGRVAGRGATRVKKAPPNDRRRIRPRDEIRTSVKNHISQQTEPDSDLLEKRAHATFTSWLIISTLLPFWFLLFVFWVASLVGIGMESITLANYILPGETLFMIFTYLGILLGILFMIYAFTIFLFRKVDCTSGFMMITFGICLALSMAPLIFFIPWVFIWCMSVVFLQTGKTKEE